MSDTTPDLPGPCPDPEDYMALNTQYHPHVDFRQMIYCDNCDTTDTSEDSDDSDDSTINDDYGYDGFASPP